MRVFFHSLVLPHHSLLNAFPSLSHIHLFQIFCYFILVIILSIFYFCLLKWEWVTYIKTKFCFSQKKRDAPRIWWLVRIKLAVLVNDSYPYLDNHTCQRNWLSENLISLGWWCTFLSKNYACYWVYPWEGIPHVMSSAVGRRVAENRGYARHLLLSILQDLC